MKQDAAPIISRTSPLSITQQYNNQKACCLSCKLSLADAKPAQQVLTLEPAAASNPYLLPTPPPSAKRSTSDPDFYKLENQKAMSSEASHLTLPSHNVAAPSCTISATRSSQKNLDVKVTYVDNLVDTTAKVIEAIWPTVNKPKSNVVPLRTFIQEVLKRSRTTYSTLQTALFYLFRVKNTIIDRLSQQLIATTINREQDYISCGRRMFLASLILASKFLQDRNYRNSAWAKISGLPVREINAAEMVFMKLIDCNLYISKATFEQWYGLLNAHIQTKAVQRRLPVQRHPSTPYDMDRLSAHRALSLSAHKSPASLHPISPPLSQSGSPNCTCSSQISPRHPDSAISLTRDNFSPPLSGKLSSKRSYTEDCTDDVTTLKRAKHDKDQLSLIMGW
ncbi:hypothetical protein INT43_000719 [Umbelopsis isabellina]|uniref:Uncharacterized protein n=1 Tax=Mortierella isabellina TaxID=91625 RepID=A0A8H7UGE2_MORIS|nr:hypothetical protein INT43_000719 [Umbelopsis isabellina]